MTTTGPHRRWVMMAPQRATTLLSLTPLLAACLRSLNTFNFINRSFLWPSSVINCRLRWFYFLFYMCPAVFFFLRSTHCFLPSYCAARAPLAWINDAEWTEEKGEMLQSCEISLKVWLHTPKVGWTKYSWRRDLMMSAALWWSTFVA